MTGTGGGYRERWLTAQDGLKLYFRDYQPPGGVTGGGPAASATPVLCLPGVSRNSKDFAPLAQRLSQGRRVICPDYRGRGRSQYDPDWSHYHPPVYVDDIRHLLCALGVHRVHVIGTSLGGILAMVMAVAMPGTVAGAVLNDIGPEIEISGLDIGDSIHASEISMDEGVELLTDPGQTVCLVSAPRVEEEEEEGIEGEEGEGEEGEEGVEGEEKAEGEEGEAKAEGEKKAKGKKDSKG
nr:alpha/beta fold hydrolase [uncultured Rhodococcus sp.]